MMEQLQPDPASSPANQRDTRKRGGRLSSVQVMFATILAIGLILAINFSSRIAAGRPLQTAYERVLSEIEQLKVEQARLVAELEYARGDEFVESWAHDEGKMVREGEVLIVPVPSGASVEPTPDAQPTVAVETKPPEPEPWLLWWGLFFDSPPPAVQ
jgi:hypothetical protein